MYICFIVECNTLDNSISEDFYKSHHQERLFRANDDAQAQKHQEHLIRKELLSLLGLHKPPKPEKSSRQNSAPRFMLELYKQLELNHVQEGFSVPPDGDAIRYNMTSLLLGNQAGDADMIMSFVNHGGKWFESWW